jgi:signal transduction histidine kinase
MGVAPIAADHHRRRQLWIDAAAASGMAALVSIGVWAELAYASFPIPPAVGAFAIGVAASAMLLFSRRNALIVNIVILGLVVGYHLLGYPGAAPALALFAALYSLAAHARTNRTIIWGVLVILAWTSVPLLPPHELTLADWSILGPAIGMAFTLALGAAIRQSRLAEGERTRRAAVDAEAQLRESLVNERIEIARELHDVLAHSLSVIAVQAGAAIDSLDDRPEIAREAMTAVRAIARESIPELRGTLELLRTGKADSHHPQPGLDRLEELADQSRRTGLTVTLDLPASIQSIPAFVQLTVYRIAQEAVTNTIRHAHATAIRIAILLRADEVELIVSDDGVGGNRPASAGLGIVGMRERAGAAGGILEAAPSEGGGFVVRAVVPAGQELT